MTDEEWLKCEDLGQMARFFQGKSCDTTCEWRLFTVACCDRAWSLIWEGHFEHLIDVLDRYAEGQASREDWHAALREHHTSEFHSADAAEEGLGFADAHAAEFALMVAKVLASR